MIDETIIKIDGTQIEQFSNESILLSMDNVGAGFSFEVPFFPGTQEYRDIFRPFQYQDVELFIGSELMLTGTVEMVSPALTDTSNSVLIQGRSKTGVIVDCTFEKSDTKQFIKSDLQTIANTAVKKFGLPTSFPDGAGAIFEKAGPSSPTSIIFEFLKNLATQRKLLMGQTPKGELLFYRANTTGVPATELIEGQQGLIISSSNYDGTKRFSKYEAYGQEPGKGDNFAQLLAEIRGESAKKKSARKVTISDIDDIVRTKSLGANDTNQGNIEDVVKWAASSDIASSINIPLGYEGWMKPDGTLWKENEFILLTSPSMMVYKPYLFLIKSVLFSSTPSQKVTEFQLTLPEAYTGEIPEAYPWE